MRILVLEDVPAMRRILAQALREEGHIVTDCEDGAISYHQETIDNIDLMITDIDMPRVNGIEAILTARRARPNLKIIAISGAGDEDADDYLNACKDLGATEILRKPFEPDVLVQTVRRLGADVHQLWG